MENFPIRLRELRKSHKIMVKTMAEMLNITPRNYQRYESGDVDPPTSKTLLLADFFNVSIDYLMGRTSIPTVNKQLQP